ncbi:hypothetical protein KAR91_00520 [Candidatus Pacearchaeota archaeon]|nr:hypothetical protein [Candidatus Pacearchaeota archaeon]
MPTEDGLKVLCILILTMVILILGGFSLITLNQSQSYYNKLNTDWTEAFNKKVEDTVALKTLDIKNEHKLKVQTIKKEYKIKANNIKKSSYDILSFDYDLNEDGWIFNEETDSIHLTGIVSNKSKKKDSQESISLKVLHKDKLHDMFSLTSDKLIFNKNDTIEIILKRIML